MNIYPDFKQFQKLSKRGNTIPIVVDLPADLETPVSVFLKLAHQKKHTFLLESVEFGERLGRFSFIGMDPDVILEYQNDTCTIESKGKRAKTRSPFLVEVERLLKRYKLASDLKLPPLVGGLVGYIGYELVQQFEDIKLRNKKGLPLPDGVLFFPANLIAFDHIKHEIKLIHLAVLNSSPKQAYQEAVRELNKMLSALKKPSLEKPVHSKGRHEKIVPRSNVTPMKFESMIRKAKEHIRAGDCIQIVPSQRFYLGHVPAPFRAYRALRSLNPSPYMFYFSHGSLSLVGSSPEMLARKIGRLAEIRPIAGTRPRGANEKQDFAYEAALKASPKEMAEHLMLVDLGRNDLGRVCNPRSVRVVDFARVERYSHVMHLVSDIEATLKSNKTAFDLLRASFPAGTVTGAPKIRAMQIIDELEPEKRGPYAGCLGYFSLTGDMDMCITIRTIVINNHQAYIQAGGGVVNDSNPRKEFNETVNKAQALLRAVEKSRETV